MRGSILHFIGDPGDGDEFLDCTQFGRPVCEYFEDGLLVVNRKGKVVAVGPYHDIRSQYRPKKIIHHKDSLIVPGFIFLIQGTAIEELLKVYAKAALDMDHYFQTMASCQKALEAYVISEPEEPFGT